MTALVLYLLLQFNIIVNPIDLTKEESLSFTTQTGENGNQDDGDEDIGGTWDDEG